jgi:hypothetical protein
MPSPTDVPRTLLSAPLPELIERLGVSIANAQSALDQSSLAIAQAMGTTMVDIDGQPRSLLELGFVPSFYAFTEATIEAKLAFTITESTEIGVSASVGVQMQVFAASVEASYSRKYSFSAEGSSSIAARLVSLPPPAPLLEILNRLAAEQAQP